MTLRFSFGVLVSWSAPHLHSGRREYHATHCLWLQHRFWSEMWMEFPLKLNRCEGPFATATTRAGIRFCLVCFQTYCLKSNFFIEQSYNFSSRWRKPWGPTLRKKETKGARWYKAHQQNQSKPGRKDLHRQVPLNLLAGSWQGRRPGTLQTAEQRLSCWTHFGKGLMSVQLSWRCDRSLCTPTHWPSDLLGVVLPDESFEPDTFPHTHHLLSLGVWAVNVKNHYPLPLTSLGFDVLYGAKIFKLDLAYHLLQIPEGDEWKKAFSIPSSH